MVILGLDPGTKRIGYGVIKKSSAGGLEFMDAGLLKISKTNGEAGGEHDRLTKIRSSLRKLIKKFKPGILAVEKLYFAKNQKTALAVAETRGVLMLTAAENGLGVEEYSPNEIKAGVTGYGLADKKAVLKMVKFALRRPDLDVIDDASDALAVALMSATNNNRIKQG